MVKQIVNTKPLDPVCLILQDLVNELHATNRIMNDIRADIKSIHNELREINNTIIRANDLF